MSTADILAKVSLASYIIAGVLLVIAIFLWFFFKIPSVMGDLSGRTAKKSIEKMRQTNAGSGNKAFLFGSLSGLVEPIFAVVGYLLASFIQVLQPWLLAFAAGAMIFVVVEDLIPDAHSEGHSHLGTWSAMLGFVIMMIMDIVL